MRTLGWLNRLFKCESGNAIIVCAATLPLVVGAAAIGVDTVSVNLARRQLQRMADSAATAGAYAVLQGESASTAANHDLGLNNDLLLSTAAVIQNAPTAGPYSGNPRAVRVVLTHERSVPFMSLFHDSTMTVSTEATAMAVFSGEYCLVALEEDNVSAIDFTGNTTVNLGCGVISNSPNPSAVTGGGSAVVTASPIAAVGGVPSSSVYASGTVLLPYSPPLGDPYATVPNPTVPSGCNNQSLNNQPNDVTVIQASQAVSGQPGVFCWKGADIKGTLTFPDNSIVYINGDTLKFGAQASVTGHGITFILTSSNAASNPASIAQIDIHGGAHLDLTASTSGTYQGLIFYQDRRAEYGSSNINGNSSSVLRGSIYFPNRQLVFNGTTGMNTQCLQLIGRRLSFSGNSTIQNSCPSGSGSSAFDATFVRLVG